MQVPSIRCPILTNVSAGPRPSAAADRSGAAVPAATTAAETSHKPSGTAAPPPASGGGDAQQKRWTFLFYINGHNVMLNNQAPAQLRMLELAGGSDDNINVVAQVARMKGSLDGISGDWHGVRRYEVPETGQTLDQNALSAEMLREFVPPYTRGIVSFMKDDLLDVDMGDPKTLSDFVKWGVQNYPAEHYCVVMLGPSQGMKGIMNDDTTGHMISPDQLKQAFDDVTKATGKKIDVLAFDASNATQAEMLYPLKDSVNYVVGSEALVTGTGMSTPSVMFELKKSNTDKTRTPEEVAQTFTMVGSMGVTNAGFTPTTSAIDMSKFGAVRDAINQLGESLLQSGVDRQHLRDIVANTQEVAMPGDTQAYQGVKDVYHFAELLSKDATVNDAAVKAAAKQVMTAVDDSLVGETHRGGQYKDSHGISVFLPDNYGYIRPDTSPVPGNFDHKFNYEDLAFAKDSPWPKFLDSIAKDTSLGRIGTKLLGVQKYDGLVGFQRQYTPLVTGLGNLASNIGWWESLNTLSSGRPSGIVGIPADWAANIGIVGGAFDIVQGIASGITDYRSEKSADALISHGLDVVGGAAKIAACVALMHPNTVPYAAAAGMFGFAKPWIQDAYGYYVQYKQIRDSIALSGPDVAQRSAVRAAYVEMNKGLIWDK